jgi:hypothetical protein
VPVINYSLGKGDWLAQRAHAYGGKVIATVTSVKHGISYVLEWVGDKRKTLGPYMLFS